MFFEVARILKDKKPKYIILENVKGLLNHERGRTFATIIKVLTDIGYQVQWQVLNSKFFGVPQNRERVYIVGCLGGECIGKIFPFIGGDSKNTVKVGLNQIQETVGNSQGSRIYTTDGVGSCLVANAGSGKTGLYCINKPRFNKYKESNIVETLKVGGDTPLMKIRNGTKKGYDIAKVGDGIALAYPNSTTRRGRVGKGCSQTLDTHCNMGTIDGYRIRRLTPTECFRLQGFPDWWCSGLETENPTDEELAFWKDVFRTFAEINGTKVKSDKQIIKWLKNPHSDSAEYKMWGNGVCLNVVIFVLSRIVKYAQ